MADRSTYSHTSDPMPDGLEFLEQYADRLGQLFNASALPLTGVGGTGNAVTATLDPPLLAGLAAGMKFTLTWAAANTGPVTLAINGGSALPVVDAAGVDFDAGALQSGERSLLEYVSGTFRVLSSRSSGGSPGPHYAVFTTSGTWNKPTGYSDDAMVLVEAWAGGGGGSSGTNGGGGGGGGYTRRWFRYGDLPSSVSVTIGPGGAVNSNGNATTFGAILTAYPGLGASAGSAGARGGSAAAGGLFGAGNGAATSGNNGGNASTEFGGAGGGAGDTVSNSAGNGGQALYGGGGGGGRSSGNGFVGTGGVSVFGGNGGDGNAAGVAPGGGGGRNAAGARGELRIWIPG